MPSMSERMAARSAARLSSTAPAAKAAIKNQETRFSILKTSIWIYTSCCFSYSTIAACPPRAGPNSFCQARLITQHQSDECFVALSRGVRQRLGVVGQSRVRSKDSRRRLDIAVVAQNLNRTRRAVRAEQLDHLRVAVPDRNA